MLRLCAGRLRDVGSPDGHGAAVGDLEPGGDAQRRGLAAAGWAEEADQLALADLEVEPLEGDGGTEGLADPGVGERAHLCWVSAALTTTRLPRWRARRRVRRW